MSGFSAWANGLTDKPCTCQTSSRAVTYIKPLFQGTWKSSISRGVVCKVLIFFLRVWGKLKTWCVPVRKCVYHFLIIPPYIKNNKNNVWGFRGERGKLRVDWVATWIVGKTTTCAMMFKLYNNHRELHFGTWTTLGFQYNEVEMKICFKLVRLFLRLMLHTSMCSACFAHLNNSAQICFSMID